MSAPYDTISSGRVAVLRRLGLKARARLAAILAALADLGRVACPL